MAKKITGPQVLTANQLSDGMAVFLSKDNVWLTSIENAQFARSEEEATDLEARALPAIRSNDIVDPYLIEIEETEAGPVPVQFRERRRIAGPSVQVTFNTRPNGQLALAS